MKKFLIILVVILLLAAGGAYWYFSIHKKAIIKQKLQETVLNKTDSLYILKYDSSYVDEVAGDASFFNVTLKLDSVVLKRMYDEKTAPDVTLDLYIPALHIRGLESVGLLAEEEVDARSIRIESPVLKFYKDKRITEEEIYIDSTEIYARLLGKYNTIKADSIIIQNGHMAWNDRVQNKIVTLPKFNAVVHNLLIDSMHRYHNLAAYFLKDATMQADNFSVNDQKNGKRYSIGQVYYSANSGRIDVMNILIENQQAIKEVHIAGLNNYEFIYNSVIKCKSLYLHDIDLSLRRIKNAGKPADSLAIHLPDIITSVEVDTLRIIEGRLAITQGNVKTVDLSGIDAAMFKTKIDSNGLSLRDIIADGMFRVSVARAALTPATGGHSILLQQLKYNNSLQTLAIQAFNMNPLNTPVGKDQFTVAAGTIFIDRFDPEKYIYQKIIRCRSVKLNNLDLQIKKMGGIKNGDSSITNRSDAFNLLDVDSILLMNGNCALYEQNRKSFDVSGLQASVYKSRIDGNNISLRNIMENGFFNIAVGQTRIYPVKGVHNITVQNVRYLNSSHTLGIGALNVTPTIKANNPAITGKKQYDLFTISCKNILAEQFDPAKFLFHNLISAASLNLSLDLRVLTDKFHGNNTESRVGQYPHQLLQKLKVQVNIPKVIMHDSYVQYTEKEAGTGQTGTLFFSNARALVTNFSNTTRGNMKVQSEGLFMNTGKARCEWDLPMGSTDGSFTVTGTMEQLNLLPLNDVSKNLANAEIVSGVVDRLAYSVYGNNYNSKGEVSFTYHDLKIKILKDDSTKVIKNAKVLSFIVGLFIKKNNSTPKSHPYTQQRDTTKSFFNLLWKSIFAGIKKAV